MSVEVDTFGSYVARNKQDENYFIELNFVLETYFDYFYNLVSNRRDLPIGPVEVYEVTVCGFHVANQILFRHQFLSQAKNKDFSFLAAAILFAALGQYMEYDLSEKTFYKGAVLEEHASKSYQSTWTDLVPLIKDFCPHFVFEQEMVEYKASVKRLKTQDNNISDEELEISQRNLLHEIIKDRLKEFTTTISKILKNNKLERRILDIYNLAIANENNRMEIQLEEDEKTKKQREPQLRNERIIEQMYQSDVKKWRPGTLTVDEKERLWKRQANTENLEWNELKDTFEWQTLFKNLDLNQKEELRKLKKYNQSLYHHAVVDLVTSHRDKIERESKEREEMNKEILDATQRKSNVS